MKIGILQTGHAPDELLPITGDVYTYFERMLDGNGFTFAIYSVVDMAFPQSIMECDGWIITGSKHGAYEDIDFIAPLEELIRYLCRKHPTGWHLFWTSNHCTSLGRQGRKIRRWLGSESHRL